LWPQFGAHQHWAKIELPGTAEETEAMRQRLADRFPLEELNRVKRTVDPKGILGNTLVDTLLLPSEGVKRA
jgi:L-galactono-1,4-lactone dehydrogenase